MAQEFKDFDVKFRKQEHELMKFRQTAVFQARVAITNRWGAAIRIWDQNFVQHCVYKAEDHEDWQLFRTCLKRGLSTAEKLTMLVMYAAYADQKGVDKEVIACRIDNYIGALKRGGQLNMALEIIK